MITEKLNCPKMNTLPKDELSGDTKANIKQTGFCHKIDPNQKRSSGTIP